MLPQSETCVFSSWPTSWRPLTEITAATHRKWCEKWSYDYYADDGTDVEDTAWLPCTGQYTKNPIMGFVKLDLFLYLLPYYKRVIWLDADMLVTNYEKNPVQAGGDIIMPYDYNGHNATVIAAKHTDLVFDFFWASNNTGRKYFMNDNWREMNAMRFFSATPPYLHLIEYRSIKELCPILGPEYAPYVPERVSAKYSWDPGDWTCHLSAFSLEKRIALAQRIADEQGLLCVSA